MDPWVESPPLPPLLNHQSRIQVSLDFIFISGVGLSWNLKRRSSHECVKARHDYTAILNKSIAHTGLQVMFDIIQRHPHINFDIHTPYPSPHHTLVFLEMPLKAMLTSQTHPFAEMIWTEYSTLMSIHIMKERIYMIWNLP